MPKIKTAWFHAAGHPHINIFKNKNRKNLRTSASIW